jgi:hypothetical protein
VNKTPFSPPWNHPDKDGGALNDHEFFEGGVDAGPFGADTCFATAVANTRSSQSLTATLFDYDRFSLPVCGKLEVQKYIDVDMSGTSNTGDVTSGAAVGGWSFTVKGPSPSTTTVCSGTTGTDGKLVCGAGQSLENLLPGTYSITETQKTGFFNTDAADNTPDPTINENATVTGTITVGVSGGTAKFGNTCFVDKTFQITSVPDSVNSVSVEYRVMTGTHAAATYTTLPLTKSGTTYSAAVNDTFNQGDTIAWRWYVNGDTANKVDGATEAAPESLASSGYSTCAKTNTDQLDLVTLQGFKFKDVNGDAAIDAGDTKAGGWEFTLKRVLGDNGTPGDPSDDLLSAVLQTVNSETGGANEGRYQFTNVAPGTYRIFETGRTGWVQTQPSSPAYRQVTVVLGATSPVSSGDFLNTPTARIDIDVTSLASLPGGGDAMEASSISCVKTAGNTNVADLTDADATGNGYQSGSVRAGSYTCTVVIIDP